MPVLASLVMDTEFFQEASQPQVNQGHAQREKWERLSLLPIARLVGNDPTSALTHLRNPVSHIVGADKVGTDCSLAPRLQELKFLL